MENGWKDRCEKPVRGLKRPLKTAVRSWFARDDLLMLVWVPCLPMLLSQPLYPPLDKHRQKAVHTQTEINMNAHSVF